MSHTERVIALIDMDCFYCQVEEKLDPNLAGKPIAIVQYNQWRGGGIIAVNYPAREKGVTRQMRGDEAKEKCPNIQLARVPQVRGKADLTKYREAGKQVAEVLKSFTNILERASIDEAYLDITDRVNSELENGFPSISPQDVSNTFVVGQETSDFLSNVIQNQDSGFFEDDMKLLMGGLIVERIRAEVYKKTGYKCSAGIAHNKILAKLVCGLHKPNKQTILPQGAVSEMFADLPIKKIKNLGGKFGHILSEKLNINYIGELVKFSEKELIQSFDEKTGHWLYNIARGIDRDPVQVKLISKSIGCCKRFPGKTSLRKPDDVVHWIKELSSEISERLGEDLKENNRKGRLMTVSFSQMTNQAEVSSTRAVPLKSYEMEKIYLQAMDVLIKYCQKTDGSYHITFLGLSISNFEDIKNVKTITSYFRKVDEVIHEIPKANSIRQDVSINPRTQSETFNKEIQKKQENDSLNHSHSTLSTDTSILEENGIYSDTTVDLEENSDDLIFYDDQSKNTFITNERSIENEVTINGDLNSFGSTREISLKDETNSNDFTSSDSPVLRSRIDEDSEEENDSFQEIERNFDTSKIFDGIHESSDEELHGNNISSGNTKNQEEFLENCKECGQLISVVDIVSHMDYHLALKLSQTIDPTENIRVDSRPKQEKPPIKKRKVPDGFGTIQSYYKKQVIDPDEITEICSECNKKIKIDDIATHFDYHAAKRLHLELNSPSSKQGNMILNNSASSSSTPVNKKKSKGSFKGGMNIATYFKHNSS